MLREESQRWEAPLWGRALLKDSLTLSKRIYTAASPARLHFTYGLTEEGGWGVAVYVKDRFEVNVLLSESVVGLCDLGKISNCDCFFFFTYCDCDLICKVKLY